MIGWRVNRSAALAEVWKRDPSWRPPASLFATPRGAIEAMESDTLAAEERLFELNAGEVVPGYVYRDGTGRRSDVEICRPNGEWIGERFGRARETVRTVSPSDFKSLWQELSANSRTLLDDVRYEGRWYETRDGSVVGLRNSKKSGWTLDLRSGSFFRSAEGWMKIHTRRDLEAKQMDDVGHIEVQGWEFEIDDTPMWDFHGAALSTTDDPAEQRAFVRTCVLRMLEAGAIPYEHRDGIPWGADTSRWEGLSPEAIADDVVAATFAAPDVFEANIWWMDGDWWKSLDHEAAARLPRPEGV